MKTTIMAFVLGTILSGATASAKEIRDCSAKSAQPLWANTNPKLVANYKNQPQAPKMSSARQAKSAQ
jgi:hypothetical protein